MNDGDLIYGLHGFRWQLLLQFEQDKKIGTRNFTINILDQYSKEHVEQLTRADRKELGKYFGANKAHPKYSRLFTELQQTGMSEHKWVENHGNDSTLQNSVIRAKSKFGLFWTINEKRGHIHFVLDDLKMYEVATKSFKDDKAKGHNPMVPDEKYRSYTGSELRWIYRRRNNPDVKARVQFWLKEGEFRPSLPPWEREDRFELVGQQWKSWAACWRAYVPLKADDQL